MMSKITVVLLVALLCLSQSLGYADVNRVREHVEAAEARIPEEAGFDSTAVVERLQDIQDNLGVPRNSKEPGAPDDPEGDRVFPDDAPPGEVPIPDDVSLPDEAGVPGKLPARK